MDTSTNTEQLNLKKQFEDPDRWDELTEPEFLDMLTKGILCYGQTNDPQWPLLIGPAYRRFSTHAAVNERQSLYDAVQEDLFKGEVNWCAILPFLYLDGDAGIVSTATLDIAMTYPATGDEPLLGPKKVIEWINSGLIENGTGALAGLANIGDKRVADLLLEERERLQNVDVAAAAAIRFPYPLEAIAHLWINWLDAIVDDESKEWQFGSIVATVERFAEMAQSMEVIEVQRNFGFVESAEPLEVVRTWQAAEYAVTVRPRLLDIAEREQEPKLMPYAIAAWEALLTET